MKKAIVLILVSGMVLAALAGCSGKTKEGESAKPDASSSPVTAKKTFTALLDNNATFPYTKEWPIWKWFDEKTGATLQVQTPSGKLIDTLNLVIASKTMPDLMYMPNRRESNKFGQQGALVNILDYLDQMPNLKKWIGQFPEEAKAALSSEGKMYMFPNHGFGETNRMVWMYREDIFRKEGLTPPKTYDELYEVLKKLKAKYPDSTPLTTRFGQIPDEMYANFTTNFQTGENVYYDFGKKTWSYGPIEDNYKAMLTMWNKFYKDGLIPPDFLSIQTKQWQDIVSTGKAFITIDYISRIDFFNNAMRKENPDFNMQFMAPPAGLPGGKQLNPYFHYLEGGLTVSSTSKNIKEVMKFMDFFYSEEGRTLASWGKEGETYLVEGGQKKFKPEFTDVTEMRKRTGLQSSGTYTWIDFSSHISLFSKDLQNAYKEAAKYDPPAMQPMPSYTEKENEVLSVTGQSVKKHRDENFAKFVTGTRSLNDWNKYVEEAKGLGIQKLVDINTEAYKRMENTQLKTK